jgi:hypothetical protein
MKAIPKRMTSPDRVFDRVAFNRVCLQFCMFAGTLTFENGVMWEPENSNKYGLASVPGYNPDSTL